MAGMNTLLSGWSRYASVQKLVHPENNPDSAKPGYWLIPIVERIQQRAYERYEQRGRTDGHELDDWLQVESEIKGHGSERSSGIPLGMSDVGAASVVLKPLRCSADAVLCGEHEGQSGGEFLDLLAFLALKGSGLA
jgi:hypothetical protein